MISNWLIVNRFHSIVKVSLFRRCLTLMEYLTEICLIYSLMKKMIIPNNSHRDHTTHLTNSKTSLIANIANKMINSKLIIIGNTI